MPELPEVETMRRGALCFRGGRIVSVKKPRCPSRPIHMAPSLAAMRRRLVGRRVKDVERLGKRVVFVLDDDQRLIFEPRMTGQLLIVPPPDPRHVRLQLEFRGAARPCLSYSDRRGLGSIHLYRPSEFTRHFETRPLGPDALDIAPDALRNRLKTTRRAVKVALLDQRLVAGIGNLYACEILHEARIHPATPSCELTASACRRLHRAMLRILNDAIDCEGSTLSDATYVTAQNTPGQYQRHHRVYGRAGETCGRCGRGQIERIVIAQRGTFYCPRCQSRRKVP